MASHRCIFIFCGRNRIFILTAVAAAGRLIFLCLQRRMRTLNLKLNIFLLFSYHNSLVLSTIKPGVYTHHHLQWGLHCTAGLFSVIGTLLREDLQGPITYFN